MQAAENTDKSSSWLDRPLSSFITLRWEMVVFLVILLVAVFSRFYDLGARVMSHDESLHTYFSWQLYKNGGFQHSPLMHGPLQFHLLALTYFLFGDSDFTSRIPAALCSIAAIAFLWNYRRYLGRTGAIAAAALFTISPYMLYYGRYVRNEAYVVLFGLVALWAVLRYLDSGENKYLYWLTAATVLHFSAKETAFIYTAQILLFLGFYFIWEITKLPWPKEQCRKVFIIVMMAALVFFSAAIALDRAGNVSNPLDPAAIETPANPNLSGEISQMLHQYAPSVLVLSGMGLLAFIISISVLVSGYGLNNLRGIRSFGLIVLLGSQVFPMLAAFPVRAVGWDPLNYSSNESLIHTAYFLVPMLILSFAAGIWWNPRVWFNNIVLFFAIFIPLFTTFFTNGSGFFSGLVGSLGYWLEQQGVRRGSQPWFYYLLVQVPLYEYLGVLGTALAAGIGITWIRRRPVEEVPQEKTPLLAPGQGRALALFVFWTFTSMAAYTLAGERMPWLTVHIALPLLLLSGWAVGYLIDHIDWRGFKEQHGGWVSAIVVVMLLTVFGLLFSPALIDSTLPGKPLVNQLAASKQLFAILVLAGGVFGLYRLLRGWSTRQFLKLLAFLIFSLIGILTIRTSVMAAYINYDRASEYMVYAHSARGVKDVMERVEDISQRTTDSLALQVGFDDDVSWPFTWYLRNYPNQRYYANAPTRDLRDLPVILVGDNNYDKIEPIVASGYYRYDYIRMWWPNQDYFSLNRERILEFFTNPALRRGVLDIWLNRDYSAYAAATGQQIDLANWSPSDHMRLYIRKDLAASLWDYGVGSGEAAVVIDPYEGKEVNLTADRIVFEEDGEDIFNAPRGLAYSPDGSLYVADSQNHRIVKLQDGKITAKWGSYTAVGEGETADGGGFNEPWGVAVSPDGRYVYVADTWNHRIQKFSAQGRFLQQWGSFGQTTDDPFLLWGPRDIIVDNEGNILVTDTGNKRVVIYSPDGKYISQFGGAGYEAGRLDEPVGITFDLDSNRVYIADTWNQRVQVFVKLSDTEYQYVTEWEIFGWYGSSLENKPYLTVGDDGNVFVSDPELGRVLVFTSTGDFLYSFGDVGDSYSVVGLASGIAPDGQGGIWLSDGSHNQLLHYTLPE